MIADTLPGGSQECVWSVRGDRPARTSQLDGTLHYEFKEAFSPFGIVYRSGGIFARALFGLVLALLVSALASLVVFLIVG